jgi:hypothetical protein
VKACLGKVKKSSGTSWQAEMIPRMSWLDNRALVATSATCRWLVLEIDTHSKRRDHTQPATLTQPVIHDNTGTHFGHETVILLEEVDGVSWLPK